MSWISFAWTTPALLAGRKTCTRREWTASHARQFHDGDLVGAYDRSPRNGGRKVAVIRLTAPVQRRSTKFMPESDWEDEGFEYLAGIGASVKGDTPAAIWADWRDNPRDLYVIRFEIIEVLP